MVDVIYAEQMPRSALAEGHDGAFKEGSQEEAGAGFRGK